MTNAKTRCWLLGRASFVEFRELVAWLRTTCELSSSPEVDVQADWIVILQSYPGEFTQAIIEQMRRQAPLSELTVVYGSWCEGEVRTGTPLAGANRCPVSAAIPHLQALAHMPRRLPTFTVADAMEAASVPCQEKSPSNRKLRIALTAKDRTQYDALAELLHAADMETIVPRQNQIPHLWLIAGEDTFDGYLLPHAQRFHAWWPDSPGYALLNFPRFAERGKLYACGIKSIFPQPFLLHEWLIFIRHEFPQIADIS